MAVEFKAAKWVFFVKVKSLFSEEKIRSITRESYLPTFINYNNIGVRRALLPVGSRFLWNLREESQNYLLLPQII